MSSIQHRIGDATSPQVAGPKIICHICNDIGGWGKGFVLALSKRWKEPDAAYRQWYKEHDQGGFCLGAVQLVQVEPDIWVANLIGQHDIQRKGVRTEGGVPPIRYGAVENGLHKVAEEARRLGASVHMPRIGCGLAGGELGQDRAHYPAHAVGPRRRSVCV